MKSGNSSNRVRSTGGSRFRRYLKRASLVASAGLSMAAGVHAQDVALYDNTDEWVDGAASEDDASRSDRESGERPRVVPPSHQVRSGDTLWDISRRYYGSPYDWPKLWSYNPQITNPHWIYPDNVVRLKGGEQGDAATTSAADPSAEASQGLSVTRRVTRGPRSLWLRDEGFLDAQALEASGTIVGSPEEQMLLSSYDEVYLRFEEGHTPRPGQKLVIYRRITDEERTADEEGTLVRILGEVEVRAIDNEKGVARALITAVSAPIERGFPVAEMPRRFEVVAAVPAEKSLKAKVVASLEPLELVGDEQVVFANVGREDGVKVGNRFFVIRKGDKWRKALPSDEAAMGARYPLQEGAEEPDYPTEIIAEARVVGVRDKTATLFVTRARYEVAIGDDVELRAGY